MKKLILFSAFCISIFYSAAQQTFHFSETHMYVQIEEMSIPSFPAFHSSAVGYYDGKWVIIGGRTNGLHGFYPPFAFPTNGIQNLIYVVDPQQGNVWSSAIDSLPQKLREQFSSSNLQHCMMGEKMYVSGGYGYSASQDKYITFPYLTEIDLPFLYQSVIAGTSPASAFKYTLDSNMAVTGGRMLSYNNRLYLFFGHKFTGRYSITSEDEFQQEYTHQLRMFDVQQLTDSISITNYTAITDSINFRRRDLNVSHWVRGINHDTAGFMAWSGVFKKNSDRPYTNPIFIRPDGSYEVMGQVLQKYNQYHCAHIPMLENEMQVMFLGGMGEGVPFSVDDTLVPFVKRVSTMFGNDPSEIVSATELTHFWGTNAEFIPVDDVFDEELQVVLATPCQPFTLVGYIVGGIESTGAHVSAFNDPSMSFASNKIYKVYIMGECWGIDEKKLTQLEVFPNPSQDVIQWKTEENVVRCKVLDISGKVVMDEKKSSLKSLDISHLNKGTYFVKLFTDGNLFRSTFIKI